MVRMGTCVTVRIALAKGLCWARVKGQHSETFENDPDEGIWHEGSHPGLGSVHHFPSFAVVGSCG